MSTGSTAYEYPFICFPTSVKRFMLKKNGRLSVGAQTSSLYEWQNALGLAAAARSAHSS